MVDIFQEVEEEEKRPKDLFEELKPETSVDIFADVKQSQPVVDPSVGLPLPEEPKDEFEHGSELSRKIFSGIADVTVGTAETGLNFLKFFPDTFSAAVGASVYSAGKGIENIITGEKNEEQAFDNWMESYNKLMQTFTYHPKSESGQDAMENMEIAFTWLAEQGAKAGDEVYEKTGSPTLATIAETSVTGSPFIVPFAYKGGKAIKGKVSKAKANFKQLKEVRAIMEEAEKGVLKTVEETVKPKPRLKLVGKGKDGKPIYKPVPPKESVKGKKAPPKKEVSTETLVRDDAKAATKVDQVYERAKIAEKKATSPTVKSAWRRVMREVFDRTEGVNRLATKFGEWGRRVRDLHNLRAGASTYALQQFHKAEKAIYGGLSHAQEKVFDKLVHSRRIIQIDEYKPGMKHSFDPDVARSYVRHLKRTLPEKEFNLLWERTDRYFAEYKRSLGRLLAEEIISKEDYMNMHRLIYQPRLRIESLGTRPKFDPKGAPISVKESGVKALGKGQKSPFLMDSKYLLARDLLQRENRIFNNRANRALYDLAKEIPDNGVVRIPKVVGETPTGGKILEKLPPRWEKVYVRIEGHRQPIYIEPGLAKQWKTGANFMDPAFVRTIRLFSGTNVLKFFATGGGSPFFFVTDFPRALMQLWWANGEFSPFAPKAVMQLTGSLARTAVDAFRMKGKYFDTYIERGGGMNFLSDEGTAKLLGSAKSEAKLAAKQSKTFRNTAEVTSHLNRSFEVWSRLATMDRALKNGKGPTEAVAIARNVTDFAKGGRYAKAADAALPYTNAILQVFRSVAQEAKVHPGQFVLKGTQVALISYMWDLANMIVNPEMWEQLPDETKVRGIVGGAGLGFTDTNGNKRYPYWEIRLDGPTIPWRALGSALAELTYYGVVNNRVTDAEMEKLKENLAGIGKEGVKQGAIPFAIDRFPLPPTLKAIVEYASNYDSWKGAEIWKGQKIKPEDEVRGATSSNPTPLFWRYLGDLTGMSPERMRHAGSQIIPANPFTYMVGHGLNSLLDTFGTEKEIMRDKVTKEWMAEFPAVRRVYNLTHPAIKEMDRLEVVEEEGGSERLNRRRTLENMLVQNQKGELPGGRQSIRTFIMGHRDPNERQSLIRTQRVFEAWERHKKMKEVVPLSRTWWTASAGLPVQDRAEVFFQEMRRLPARDRQLMMQFAQRISVGRDRIAYYTPEFRKKLNQIIKERGLD